MSRQGPTRQRTLENIRQFWEAEAGEIGATPRVTIRDFYFRVHELHTLLALVPRCARLLDVGCGTGFGTLMLSKKADYCVGVDRSAGMLAWAQESKREPKYRAQLSREFGRLWDLPESDGRVVEFLQGDVAELDLGPDPFDVLTAQRLLINLPTREWQRRALRRLRQHARIGSLLVLVETTEQGYGRTDAYRALFDLPPLERYWHNLYVDEASFDDWRLEGWSVETILSFDTYMLLSKVIYPAACGSDRCQFLSATNAAAMELASVFRTRSAVAEIGEATMLRAFSNRVTGYDAVEGAALEAWMARQPGALPDWNGLGHHRIIVARAINASGPSADR